MLVYKAVSRNWKRLFLITINFMTDECHDFKNYLLLFLSFKFDNIECNKDKSLSQDGQSLVFVSITQPSDSSEGFFMKNIFGFNFLNASHQNQLF